LTVSALGEFHLIDRLAALVARPAPPELKVGIGDDAAAWETAAGATTVATSDALVEGVHFDLATTSWQDLGWKALAENVSDVAAMGCQPRYAFVVLGLPASTPVAGVEDLYRGLGECARAYGCTIAGGDVVSAPNVFLSVTLVGESIVRNQDRRSGDPILVRSGARAGDVLAVTGPLGGSAAGLRLLQAGWDEAPADDRSRAAAELVQIHRRPMPRVVAGRALVEAGVRCAIDVSDGLMADVGHICERSAVDAELDVPRVPVHPAALTCFPELAQELALSGGEDYELVCSGPSSAIESLSARLGDLGEPPLTVIGTIVPQVGPAPRVRLLGANEVAATLGAGGYRHF
jgi:thiamine-monophosphate kinase